MMIGVGIGSSFFPGVVSGGEAAPEFDLYIWGTAAFTGQGAAVNTPLQAGADKTWYQVGTGHSVGAAGVGFFAVDSTGKLWAQGTNSNGQLGLGNQTTPITTLTQVGSDTDWKDCQIQQAGGLSFALKNGRLYSCGVGTNGQLANGTTSGVVSSFTQIGTDTDWESFAVTTGGGHAIKTNGTLWGWGTKAAYRLGDGVNTGTQSTPIQIGTDTDWKYIQCANSAGGRYAIKDNGTLWVWGANTGKQLGTGTSGVDVQTITQVGSDTNWAEMCGVAFGGLFRKTNGTIYAIGSDSLNDQLGLGDGVTATTITQIGTDTDWEVLAGTTYNGFAIKTNKDLYTWGDMPAYAGQGPGTTDISVPTKVASLSNVEQIHVCASGVAILVPHV